MVPLTNVSVSGRVLTSIGAGIRNAEVTLSGGTLPGPRRTSTGSFGYFSFSGLQPGVTYTVTVATKHYVLTQPSRNVTPQSDVTNFDFVAQPF